MPSQEILRDVRIAITLNQLSSERIFLGVEHALGRAGYAQKFVKNPRVLHEEFRDLVERLPGVRAVIAVGPDGDLVTDSYAYPAPDVNLNDRSYVKAARSTPGLHIGETAIGKTSGIPFLPVAKRVGDYVIAAILSPHFLIHEEGRCTDCVSAIILEDGTVVTAFPHATKLPPQILSLPLVNKSLEGSTQSLFNQTPSVIGWRRSGLYNFIVLGARGVSANTPIGINDR